MSDQRRPTRAGSGSSDVLFVSDLRFPGGTSSELAAEIEALHERGYALSIAHVESPLFQRGRSFNSKVTLQLAAGRARLVAPGERSRARIAILHNPLVFQGGAEAVAPLAAESAVMVLSHCPFAADGGPNYDLDGALAAAARLVGADVLVAPASPVCRRNLLGAGRHEARLLAEDWSHVVRVEDFEAVRPRPSDGVPAIGRHGRPGAEKWPDTRADLLAAYPDRGDMIVRMLGAGPALARLVPRLPERWEIYEFGDLDVRAFLAAVDFWVYFHSGAIVEGFGLAVAEAMASGAVALLPSYLEPNFLDGAIYCAPSEVTDIVAAYARDPEAYLRQSARGRAVIAREYGPGRLVDRVERLIGPPAPAVEREGIRAAAVRSRRRAAATAGARPAPPAVPSRPGRPAAGRERTYDVVFVMDVCALGEEPIRVARELAALDRAGLSVGLAHVELPQAQRGSCVHADLRDVLRSTAVEAFDPAGSLVVASTAVTTSATLARLATSPARIHVAAARAIVVTDDDLPAADVVGRLAAHRHAAATVFVGAEPLLTACRPDRYELLRRLAQPSELAPPWRLGTVSPGVRKREDLRRLLGAAAWRIGTFSQAGSGQWSTLGRGLERAFPAAAGWEVWVYGAVGDELRPVPEGWRVIDETVMGSDAFLSRVDVVVYFPGNGSAANHLSAVAAACALGIPVIAAEELRGALGACAIYRRPEAVPATLLQLRERPMFRRLLQESAKARTGRETAAASSPAAELATVAAGAAPRRPRKAWARRRPRALFLCSNGVGVGHLTRLLAVARRVDRGLDPVFFSLSQAGQVVRRFGFPCEYMPSADVTFADHAEWNEWFELTLAQVLDGYGINTVVFDGSLPYIGMCREVASRRDCRLVWVRRGMWRASQDNSVHLSRSPFADLIIAPGEVAASHDHGATVAAGDGAVAVDPIRLLDEHELLPRRRACAALGLDPHERYMLIQLGAGNNFSFTDLIDRIVARLQRDGGVRPVIAQWLTSSLPPDLWRGVPRLRCYPISRYYKAFDFSVSAAGYNSFHEVIGYGVPTVFAPNRHEIMDDQAGRAAFADGNDAAIYLDEDAEPLLDTVLTVMLDAANRAALRRGCRRLARPNGAVEAARLVERVARWE